MPKKQRAGAENENSQNENENSQNENENSQKEKNDSQNEKEETPVKDAYETPSTIDELSETPEADKGTLSSDVAKGLSPDSEDIDAIIGDIEKAHAAQGEAISQLKERLSKKGGKSKKNKNNKKQRKTRKQRRR